MRLKEIFQHFIHKLVKDEKPDKNEEQEAVRKENPYLPKFRFVLDQILEMRELCYRDFKPILVDTDMPPESLLDEDDIEIALEQISKDLNFLTILTERPEYFSDYIDTMYEETGLAVSLYQKSNEKKYTGNVILDFEQTGRLKNNLTVQEALYIPVYKKSWETAENLDIYVPIGYNTVTVKGR